MAELICPKCNGTLEIEESWEYPWHSDIICKSYGCHIYFSSTWDPCEYTVDEIRGIK